MEVKEIQSDKVAGDTSAQPTRNGKSKSSLSGLSFSSSRNKLRQGITSDASRQTMTDRQQEGKAYKNNTYELKSEEQLTELVSQAEKYKEGLSESEKERYNSFLDKIVRNDDGSINISDVDTLKAFLYFKKLVKYEGNMPPDVIKYFDENSKLLGLYAKEYQDFLGFINREDLVSTIENFYESIYDSQICFENIATKKDLEKTREFQEEMLTSELKRLDAEDELKRVSYMKYDDIPTNRTYISDKDDKYNNWHAYLSIQERGIVGGGIQTSREVVILHELYHIRQHYPGEPEGSPGRIFLGEIGATLDTIVRFDEIHKLASNIPLENEVEYKEKIECNGRKINVGLLANVFREIKTKNHFETYEEAMMSEEGLKFITTNFSTQESNLDKSFDLSYKNFNFYN